MADQHYVRNTQGKVFGPIALDALKAWVKDGRVEPLAGVSTDLKNWILAPLMPELEMNWVVENNPGQFYGPTHRAVVDDFVKSGALSASARFYQDDRGVAAVAQAELTAAKSAKLTAEALAEKARGETQEARKQLEALKIRAAADLAAKDAAISEAHVETQKQRGETEKARGEAQKARGEVQEMRQQLEAARRQAAADLAAKDAEIGDLKAEIAKLTAVHEATWETEVLEPEVVLNEAPPAVARQAFGGGSLADLERQAQAELARMGANGAKRFFGFGKK